jgi:hypothetical protein
VHDLASGGAPGEPALAAPVAAAFREAVEHGGKAVLGLAAHDQVDGGVGEHVGRRDTRVGTARDDDRVRQALAHELRDGVQALCLERHRGEAHDVGREPLELQDRRFGADPERLHVEHVHVTVATSAGDGGQGQQPDRVDVRELLERLVRLNEHDASHARLAKHHLATYGSGQRHAAIVAAARRRAQVPRCIVTEIACTPPPSAISRRQLSAPSCCATPQRRRSAAARASSTSSRNPSR